MGAHRVMTEGVMCPSEYLLADNVGANLTCLGSLGYDQELAARAEGQFRNSRRHL